MRISDWSSDVCSSDLLARADLQFPALAAAADVDFGARLGEGEVAGPEAQRQVLDSEEGPAEGGQRTLQVPHVAFLVDHQPLDLMEHRRVRGIVKIGRASCRERVCQYV